MSFGEYGSVTEHQRYMEPVESKSRRRCNCGCNKRATHFGMANGVSLTMGCELYVRRWVRDGIKARNVKAQNNKWCDGCTPDNCMGCEQ